MHAAMAMCSCCHPGSACRYDCLCFLVILALEVSVLVIEAELVEGQECSIDVIVTGHLCSADICLYRIWLFEGSV